LRRLLAIGPAKTETGEKSKRFRAPLADESGAENRGKKRALSQTGVATGIKLGALLMNYSAACIPHRAARFGTFQLFPVVSRRMTAVSAIFYPETACQAHEVHFFPAFACVSQLFEKTQSDGNQILDISTRSSSAKCAAAVNAPMEIASPMHVLQRKRCWLQWRGRWCVIQNCTTYEWRPFRHLR